VINYQSYAGTWRCSPILVTARASMTIIDNDRDTVDGGGSWGPPAHASTRTAKAPLIAERRRT
jgi:hypothetical protein